MASVKVIIVVLSVLVSAGHANAKYSWTMSISEENPDGQNCPVYQSVTAARCMGDYCDNMELGCQPLPFDTWLNYESSLVPYWTQYISEEGTGFVECDWGTQGLVNGLMIGMRAEGDYSDNISVHCAQLMGTLVDCKWTDWFSEEAYEQDFPDGYFATGVRCSGDYCDDLSFRICKVVP